MAKDNDIAIGCAFVAGATGYTGREVVRLLVEKGVPAIAHIRPDSNRMEEWKERFGALGAEFDVTPWEEAAMTQTMARVKPSFVFALLGTTMAPGFDFEDLELAQRKNLLDQYPDKKDLIIKLT